MHGDQRSVNDWQFWVYPEQAGVSEDVSDDLLVVQTITDDVAKRLQCRRQSCLVCRSQHRANGRRHRLLVDLLEHFLDRRSAAAHAGGSL